jgi:hypothetical protein
MEINVGSSSLPQVTRFLDLLHARVGVNNYGLSPQQVPGRCHGPCSREKFLCPTLVPTWPKSGIKALTSFFVLVSAHQICGRQLIGSICNIPNFKTKKKMNFTYFKFWSQQKL